MRDFRCAQLAGLPWPAGHRGSRTRKAGARTGRAGKWRTETVYAITDLPPHEARPDELAAWIRGQWQIEVRREVALV